jgi:hypothetical protein
MAASYRRLNEKLIEGVEYIAVKESGAQPIALSERSFQRADTDDRRKH